MSDKELESFGTGASVSEITTQLARQFLKYVADDRDERCRVISFITLRAAERGEIFDRLQLASLI